MTRLEKAVKIVSDLFDFYRQIPKIPEHDPVRKGKHDEYLHQREREPRLSESPPARGR